MVHSRVILISVFGRTPWGSPHLHFPPKIEEQCHVDCANVVPKNAHIAHHVHTQMYNQIIAESTQNYALKN